MTKLNISELSDEELVTINNRIVKEATELGVKLESENDLESRELGLKSLRDLVELQQDYQKEIDLRASKYSEG
ncbi:hypothetical protein [Pseudoalteromonas denitrificans]|uniref:Uncharacterized protein n=1 Tax=Pseudoalteromonas denitrificans DSM 6059 TaxID=1123010 RepID=A0A1I1MQ61_9GAMM|nr:hypothetical protein [Pseudoalteromonas denitrificans]SFC87607.1 hypothetical protein SAMN02745724_02777 [Pseudoalteromonas denitrificans DSM 6059]